VIRVRDAIRHRNQADHSEAFSADKLFWNGAGAFFWPANLDISLWQGSPLLLNAQSL
jgi:hypothetical protein